MGNTVTLSSFIQSLSSTLRNSEPVGDSLQHWPSWDAGGSPAGSILANAQFLSLVAFYLDRVFTLPRLGEIIGELHPHKVLHFRPERFFNPQGHIARERGFLIKQA